MKVLNLKRNSFNIQKFLLPDSDHVKNHSGKFAVVNIRDEFEFTVQIRLCKHKQLHETCYIDTSVVKFFLLDTPKERVNLTEISVNDLKIIPTVEKAKVLIVTVVFNDVFHIKKYEIESLKILVKEILKLYVFSKDSVVFLSNLSRSQNLDLYCVVVNSVNSNGSDFYRVTGATTIIIQKRISKFKFKQSCTGDDIYIGGCNNIYKVLRESVEFSQFLICKKLLLIGPPGCGKTSLVKKIARDCDCVLLEVLAPDINISQPGETEKKLKEIFKKAKSHAENEEKCLILIDELDSICMKNDDDTSSLTKRTIRQLIILLEEIKNTQGIVVIATTNCPDELDFQLRRSNCFENELEISVPNQNERVEIIKNILEYHNVNCSDTIIQEVSAWTPGYVGADLNLIILEAKNLLKKMNCDEEKLRDCFKKAVSKATPSGLKGAIGLQTSKETQFSEIGGLDNIISLLNFSVKQQLLNPAVYRRLGIPLTKGILLYGPPGCAKTTLVKALAKECNTTFLAVSAADLFSPFVGDAERLVIKLFSQARISAPAIIFIDEIDAIIGSKSGREKGVQERVLSALLIEMDGVGIKLESSSHLSRKLLEGDDYNQIPTPEKSFKDENNNNGIIVIGATNRPELIDDALIRPGRFDKLIYVPCPNKTQRFEILKKVTSHMPLDESVDLDLISELTERYSGADLKNLCMEAGLQVLTEEGMGAENIRQEHFECVMKKIQPSLNEKHFTMYENFRKK